MNAAQGFFVCRKISLLVLLEKIEKERRYLYNGYR